MDDGARWAHLCNIESKHSVGLIQVQQVNGVALEVSMASATHTEMHKKRLHGQGNQTCQSMYVLVAAQTWLIVWNSVN